MEQAITILAEHTETTNHNGLYVMKKHSLFKPDRTLQDQKEHSVPLSEEQGRARSPWSQ